MFTKQLSLMESYDFVKRCRPAIAPNISFMGQLLQFEERHQLGKKKERPQNKPSGV